jgi:transposase
MITPPPGVRVYLACGYTDMRKGISTLAMLVQQTLGFDPFCGAIYAFRGRRSGTIKVLWHDGVGMCLFINYLSSYYTSFACCEDFGPFAVCIAAARSVSWSHRLECLTGGFGPNGS